jgi:hypothetical protein
MYAAKESHGILSIDTAMLEMMPWVTHIAGATVGKRSGVPRIDKAVSEMSLADLNADIQRCLWGAENGGTSQGRKAFFKRLVWLEKARETLHNVPASRRAFRSR